MVPMGFLTPMLDALTEDTRLKVRADEMGVSERLQTQIDAIAADHDAWLIEQEKSSLHSLDPISWLSSGEFEVQHAKT